MDVVAFLLALTIGLSPFSLWLILGMNSYISDSIAETIFVALIQVNGALIAFFGIILVHNLRKYSNDISNATNHAIHFLEQIQQIECDIEYNKDNQNLVNHLTLKRNKYVENSNQNADWIYETNKKRSKFSNDSIAPVISFVLSILLSVISLTTINSEGIIVEMLIITLVPMFFGILGIVATMGSSIPPLNPELQKRMNKKPESE